MTETGTVTINEAMMEAIKSHLPKGDIIPGVVANHVIDDLRASNPELLSRWLDERANAILHDFIRAMFRSDRTSARHAAAREFSERLKTLGPSGLMAVYHKINDQNVQRCAAEMNGTEHRYVANSHGRNSRREATIAAFHLAVAKKIGNKKTKSVFTEDQYEALYRSIANP